MTLPTSEPVSATADTFRERDRPPASVALPSSLVPAGSQYDNLRSIVVLIESNFPGEVPELTDARIAGWVAEIDSGTGRSDDDIRDEIVQFVITEPVLQNFLDNQGITDVTPADLIAGGNEGGVNFSALVGVPSQRPGTERPGVEDPEGNLVSTRIPADLRLIRVLNPKGSDAAELFTLVGDVFGVELGFEVGDIARLRELFGGVDAFDNVTTLTQQQFDESILIVGTVDEIAGSTESLQARFERDLRAAGLENPPQWLAQDQQAMTRWLAGVNDGFSAERLWSEISDTDAFKGRFAGLDTVFDQLGTNQFITAIAEFTNREALIRQHITTRRGPGADTSIEYVSSLIASGWQPAEVDELLVLERQLRDSPEALDNMNQILAFQELPELSPDDFISFLQDGQRFAIDPDFIPGDLFEGINDALRFQALIEEGIQIDEQFATDLGEGVSDAVLSPDQFSERARFAAIEIARNTTELDRQTLGITREDIIAATFGEESPSGKSVSEISELLERLGRDRAKRATGLPSAASFVDAFGRLRVQGSSNL